MSELRRILTLEMFKILTLEMFSTSSSDRIMKISEFQRTLKNSYAGPGPSSFSGLGMFRISKNSCAGPGPTSFSGLEMFRISKNSYAGPRPSSFSGLEVQVVLRHMHTRRLLSKVRQ